MCGAGQANRTGLGEGLEPRCDIDCVPQEIASLNHHIADVETYAEPKLLIVWVAFIEPPDGLLNLNGALHCIDGTRELSEHTVPSRVRYAAPVFGYEPIHDLPVSREPPKRPHLVLTHEARITRHVSREDRCELAFDRGAGSAIGEGVGVGGGP
jgi:hypothetical protein